MYDSSRVLEQSLHGYLYISETYGSALLKFGYVDQGDALMASENLYPAPMWGLRLRSIVLCSMQLGVNNVLCAS
jgi:hypothetical protein